MDWDRENGLDVLWERQRQLRGCRSGLRQVGGGSLGVHPATTLSSYIMSQVQYSPGWLFKVRLSDKKVIYLVATAQHESLCRGYIGHRQAWGMDLDNVAVIFRPGDDLEYLHHVEKKKKKKSASTPLSLVPGTRLSRIS